MYFSLGNNFYKKGEYLEALRCYEMDLQTNKDLSYKVKNHFNIGVCYIKLRKFRRAKQCFFDAIGEDVAYANAYFNLGHIAFYEEKDIKAAYRYARTAYVYNSKDEIIIEFLNVIIEKMQIENHVKIEESNPIYEVKEIVDKNFFEKKSFILYHKKNKGFELVEYSNTNNSIEDKTLLIEECKRRGTKKYNKILEKIKEKYNIKKVIQI